MQSKKLNIVSVNKTRKARNKDKKNKQLYTSYKWKMLRKKILIRDEYKCNVCGVHNMLHVDHIKPIAQGGEIWDENNLQVLCRYCHEEKTKKEQDY